MGKKAQEEITGFVVVVILVAIILVVLLAILIRQKGSDSYMDSREVGEFLRSTFEYTTECAISYEPDYSVLRELLAECRSGRLCKSGKLACKVLNDTISKLINSAWQIGPDRPIKGYEFDARYGLNISQSSNSILALSSGNCSANIRGAEEAVSDSPGRINVKLVLCY